MRRGVIWQLQRNGERCEATVAEREPGRCELGLLRNGALLKSLWLAAGQGLSALERVLTFRDDLKASGWAECPG